jgi:hypothetical protein
MSIQLRGNLKLGPSVGTAVEFGSSITSFIVKTEREVVTLPATLATGRASESAGAMKQMVQIDFFSSLAATGASSRPAIRIPRRWYVGTSNAA